MHIVGKELLKLIPQRPPMVMIEKLIYSDEKRTQTILTVKHDNIFCSNELFREPGIIENMAQTAAAGVGYFAKINNIKVKTGFIGAIKNLKIHSLPKIGSELKTEVNLMNKIGDVSVISGKVFCKDNLIACCEMKIFLM